MSSIKVIHLEQRHGVPSDYLGKFVDESNYDHLIAYDCDVYGPLPLGETEHSEKNLILKFRKGVFPTKLVRDTHANIREAATQSQNRGIAAGPRGEKLGGRDWVTKEQSDILTAFLNSGNGSLLAEELSYTGKADTENRGNVWLSDKVKKLGFNFATWFETNKDKSPEERKKAAKFVLDELISDTTYANTVYSGISGYYDRYPRIPYCRETAFTAKNFEKWSNSIPFIEAVSEQFRLLTPKRFAAQLSEIEKLDPGFRVGKSAYTTVTVNKNYRTACHRDAGDLAAGFGNLTVVTDGTPYKGGYLVFPEFRTAVDVQPGDMLAMQIHEIHGNTPIFSDGDNHERISIVCYFREGMKGCKSKVYENLRFQFVEDRRKNQNHPLWNKLWNGVSPGMWEGQEWADYLAMNGMEDEDGVVSATKENDLSSLFG